MKVLLAPLRCLVLFGLTVVGLVAAELSGLFLAVVVTYPWIVAGNRLLARLGRRWSRDWCGVPIAAGYRPLPTDPVRRDDGWYAHNNQLFRHAVVPRYLRRYEALTKDPAGIRDWMWLALTPAAGGAAVLLPVALLAAAGYLAVTGGAWWIAAACVAASFAVAPFMLRLYGWWSRVLLQPLADSWWGRSGIGGWLGRRYRGLWRGAALAGLCLGALGLGLLTVLTFVFYTTPAIRPLMTLSRRYLDYYRSRVTGWTGVAMPSPYRPMPSPPAPDASGQYRAGRVLYRDRAAAARAKELWAVQKDPASWRDLLWMLTAPLFSPLALGLAAIGALAYFALFWQVIWWIGWGVPIFLFDGTVVPPWFAWEALALAVPFLGVVPGWATPFLGLVLTLVVMAVAAPLLRLRVAYDRWLLSPTRAAALAQRVDRLTESRRDAVDAQAAEVRRIERDLHDGAQARLVSVGLSLATVEKLMERDPEAARTLLAQARETSATALTELRDLVRGIHPPVLAERGLVDAVRAVALDCPLPTAVTASFEGRLAAPVESAAYFAVCEALANAARHAGASRLGVRLDHDGERLRIAVTDDGRGGADPSRGTGLSGIGRRLGTFDGTLVVQSPPGGPTTLTMEVPCAFSSPKTSTS